MDFSNLDLWQNIWFNEPDIIEIGICTYSTKKLNGGCVFYQPSAIDIIDKIIKELEKGEEREEPIINKILKSSEYKKRVTILNSTYNVGASGYYPRALKALKPIKCVHMNPKNRISWETHRLNRDGMSMISVSNRLEHVLRRYFPNLAKEISEEGKSRSIELREKHLAKVY